MNLEWTFVLFTHFGVTSGISRNPWVIPEVTPKWVKNTNVHSKFTLISLFSKIHSLKSEHIHSFLFREYNQYIYYYNMLYDTYWKIINTNNDTSIGNDRRQRPTVGTSNNYFDCMNMYIIVSIFWVFMLMYILYLTNFLFFSSRKLLSVLTF